MRIRYSMLAVLCAGACAFAQQQPAPSSSSKPATAQTKSDQKDAAPSGANPFPEAQSQKTASKSTSAHAQARSDQTTASPSEANPFPEAKSQKAADAANAAAQGNSSSSHVDLNRLNAPPGSVKRIENGKGGYIHNPQLAAQDDKVGGFYLQTGDYKGAYDRFLEATRVAPEDGKAVFGLAEAARGLHRTEEAITNYTIYLKAFPDGKKAKDAEKALKQLTSAKLKQLTAEEKK